MSLLQGARNQILQLLAIYRKRNIAVFWLLLGRKIVKS